MGAWKEYAMELLEKESYAKKVIRPTSQKTMGTTIVTTSFPKLVNHINNRLREFYCIDLVLDIYISVALPYSYFGCESDETIGEAPLPELHIKIPYLPNKKPKTILRLVKKYVSDFVDTYYDKIIEEIEDLLTYMYTEPTWNDNWYQGESSWKYVEYDDVFNGEDFVIVEPTYEITHHRLIHHKEGLSTNNIFFSHGWWFRSLYEYELYKELIKHFNCVKVNQSFRNYEVDFIVYANTKQGTKIGMIELNGYWHNNTKEYDNEKKKYLMSSNNVGCYESYWNDQSPSDIAKDFLKKLTN